jgi:hypothetical protein
LCFTLRRSNAVKEQTEQEDCRNGYRYVFDPLHHASRSGEPLASRKCNDHAAGISLQNRAKPLVISTFKRAFAQHWETFHNSKVPRRAFVTPFANREIVAAEGPLTVVATRTTGSTGRSVMIQR